MAITTTITISMVVDFSERFHVRNDGAARKVRCTTQGLHLASWDIHGAKTRHDSITFGSVFVP